DFIDCDLSGDPDRMVPIRLSLTVAGDSVTYDLTGSDPAIGCSMKAGPAASFSAVVGGMKTFFPDIPLNSGFYRPLNVILPPGSVVNATPPTAVSGFVMPYEKIFNLAIELWSELIPARAMACSF